MNKKRIASIWFFDLNDSSPRDPDGGIDPRSRRLEDDLLSVLSRCHWNLLTPSHFNRTSWKPCNEFGRKVFSKLITLTALKVLQGYTIFFKGTLHTWLERLVWYISSLKRFNKLLLLHRGLVSVCWRPPHYASISCILDHDSPTGVKLHNKTQTSEWSNNKET